MKKRTLKSLDINPYIGAAQIAGGQIELEIPRLSGLRIIEIVKLLGAETARVWTTISKYLNDSSFTDQEVIYEVVKVIPSEVLPELLSILLDIDEESAGQLDLNDILEIALVYVKETDLKQTFFQIQKIYKEIYGRDLPNLASLFPTTEQTTTLTEARQMASEAVARAAEAEAVATPTAASTTNK